MGAVEVGFGALGYEEGGRVGGGGVEGGGEGGGGGDGCGGGGGDGGRGRRGGCWGHCGWWFRYGFGFSRLNITNIQVPTLNYIWGQPKMTRNS